MSFHYSKALTVAISLISASGLISGTVHANPADAALQQLPPGLEDLPPGRVRDKIASLPPAAQKQALNWLERFSIPEQDYDHVDVDPEGGIFYIDEKTVPESSEELPSPESGLSATDTFTLHSKPGASNIIYLDVDGHTIEGTIWNGSVSAYHAKPFDRDGSPYTYSQSELDDIAAIWHRVAEDYAAFDVDVTTEAPAQMGPTVGRILITHNTDENGTAMPHSSAGGVAYLGVWGRSNYTYYQPALVYYNNLGGGAPRYVSEAASHEMGHNQGLGHDGTLSGSAYYNGHGSGYTRWGPIMGVGYNTHVSQWSKGDYNDANNTQDDFGIIAANVGLRPDDHGDDISSASALEIDGAGQIVVTTPENDPANYYSGNKGVISSRNDIDVFEIISGEGTINVTVTPAWLAFNDNYARGANLDIEATLLNAQGQVVSQSSPTTDTYAEIQYQASAGAYYLAVTGVGDTPSASTYDDYGSQGLYYISGSISPNQSNNNAPEAQNDSASTTEDQAINIAVLSNDSDIDGDTLVLSQVNNGTLGTTQIQGGTIEYTPFANANGTDQFSYTIIDGQGGSATATVTVSISAVNDAPVAVNDSETLSQDSSSLIAVLNNDSDPDGDALTVTAVNQPANGTATINGNSINYTPASGYTGPDSFTYTISDTGGLTSTATVSVFVNELVEPPVTPANFIAVDGTDGAAHLSWTDTDNETGFEIQRETKHKKRNTWNGTTTVASPSQDTTVYSDNVGTGTFRYRARSSNSEGVSPWSAWSEVTVTDASGGGDSGGSGGGKGGGKGRNK